MYIPKVLFLGASLALFVLACDSSPDLDVRTFQLQHRSGYEAAELIAPYVFTDRTEDPGSMSATDNALSVRESPDNLDKIARVLEEFDRPKPGVRLHFQLIAANGASAEDPSIAPVVEQLRSLFRFQGYRLLGEASVSVSGSGEFRQRIMGEVDPALDLSGRVISTGTGSLRLDGLRLENPWDVLLESSVTVAPGQTLVIGGGQDSYREETRSLILTVRAEVE